MIPYAPELLNLAVAAAICWIVGAILIAICCLVLPDEPQGLTLRATA